MASFDADDFDIDGSQIGGYAKDVYNKGLYNKEGFAKEGFGNRQVLDAGLEGGGPLVPNRFVFVKKDKIKLLILAYPSLPNLIFLFQPILS
jgi:hypothetical protein